MVSSQHTEPKPISACAMVEAAGRGMVYFLGAGPGDPELLTLKAQRIIAQADVIIYAGSLVNPQILAHARPDAVLHDSARLKLEQQVEIMHTAVARGQMVARLQSGDPSLYGSIAEQISELGRLGVPYAIIPGVSSALAAAAVLGIEYTLPQGTQTAIFCRLAGKTPVPDSEALRDLAAHRCSLVIFLSAGMIVRVVNDLIAAGYEPDTPIAVVQRVSWPDEVVLRGTLADIVAQCQAAEITHQALIVVSPALAWGQKGQPAARSHLYGQALTTPPRENSVAIIALSCPGSQVGLTLHRALPDSKLYVPTRFLPAEHAGLPGIVGYDVSVRQVLQEAFRCHRALVCVMAMGIVVRELAPLLSNKHNDPGVVVVDDLGQQAISMLAGHWGGANDLARAVASILGGRAVITTASDVQGLPAVDLLGQTRRWKLADRSALTAVASALVNGDLVGVFQEAGDEAWWPTAAPSHLIHYHSLETLCQARPVAAILITYHEPPASLLAAIPHVVVYHPPCLAVGIGCNRGVSAEEILTSVDQTFAENGLALSSLAMVATVEDKSKELGLQRACLERGWPLRTFTRRQLAAVDGLPNPSPWAVRTLGVPGVAEPSALLAAQAGALLVEKRKYPNVTVAVALCHPGMQEEA